MSLPPRYPLIRYLSTESEYLKRIRRALQNAADQLARDIAASGSDFEKIRLHSMRTGLQQQLRQSWDSIEQAIYEGQRDVMDDAKDVLLDYEDILLRGFELFPETVEAILNAEGVRAAAAIEAVAARAAFSRKGLSELVWGAEARVNSKLDEIIDAGLARGLSARDLAKQVRNFVSPNTPGGASYAAMRLARTEINNAYHAASVETYKRSKMVDKVKWNLSSSHPEGDICDDYATDSPYDIDSVPEKPHPHCFCFTTAELPTREQFINDLFDGKYDDDIGPDTPTDMADSPDLGARVMAGEGSRKTLSTGTASGRVERVDFPDGSSAVIKGTTEEYFNNEQAAAALLREMGLNPPRSWLIYENGTPKMVQQFVDGETAWRVAGNQKKYDALYQAMLRNADSGVREMAWMDTITNNIDRNAGNWLINNARAVPIDHDMAVFNRSYVSYYLEKDWKVWGPDFISREDEIRAILVRNRALLDAVHDKAFDNAIYNLEGLSRVARGEKW